MAKKNRNRSAPIPKASIPKIGSAQKSTNQAPLGSEMPKEVSATDLISPPPPVAVVDSEPDPPLTWSERAQGGSKKLEKCGSPYRLESGELCVTIPNSVIEESKVLWKSFVVGQFYRKAPSFGKVHAIANLLWSKWHRDVTVTKLDSPNTFLFKIPNVSARKRVLEEGIWSIDGSTMFVAEWAPGTKLSNPALRTAPVWVELRKVPYEFYNPKALSHIASL